MQQPVGMRFLELPYVSCMLPLLSDLPPQSAGLRHGISQLEAVTVLFAKTPQGIPIEGSNIFLLPL